jgi:hypothetical protein
MLIETQHKAPAGSKPEISPPVFHDLPDIIFGDTLRFMFTVLELFKLAGLMQPVVVPGNASVFGGDPDHAILIFIKVVDNVAGEAGGIIRVIPEYGKKPPIVAVQAIFGPEPEKAPLILEHTIDLIMRKPVASAYPLKEYILLLCPRRKKAQEKQHNSYRPIPEPDQKIMSHC